MKKEFVKELNNLSLKLEVKPILYRCIVAEALVLARKGDFPPTDEEVYNITKRALKKVDNTYAVRCTNSTFPFRSYGKELVEEVLEEMGQKKR